MKHGIFALTAAFLLALPMTAMAGPVCQDTSDTDNDGIQACGDSCLAINNSGTNSCDTDLDGYGNPCDGDFDNNLSTNANDFTLLFLPRFLAGVDVTPVGADMDCGGTVNANDFTLQFLPEFAAPGLPGPSGIPCAGTVSCTP